MAATSCRIISQPDGYQTAFTVELDPARDDPDKFVLREDRIMSVFERNIRGALALIECAGIGGVGYDEKWRFANPIKAVFKKYGKWAVTGRGNCLPTP
jgi:hypothetical protein